MRLTALLLVLSLSCIASGCGPSKVQGGSNHEKWSLGTYKVIVGTVRWIQTPDGRCCSLQNCSDPRGYRTSQIILPDISPSGTSDPQLKYRPLEFIDGHRLVLSVDSRRDVSAPLRWEQIATVSDVDAQSAPDSQLAKNFAAAYVDNLTNETRTMDGTSEELRDILKRLRSGQEPSKDRLQAVVRAIGESSPAVKSVVARSVGSPSRIARESRNDERWDYVSPELEIVEYGNGERSSKRVRVSFHFSGQSCSGVDVITEGAYQTRWEP